MSFSGGAGGCVPARMNPCVGDEMERLLVRGCFRPLRRGRETRVNEVTSAPSGLTFFFRSTRRHHALAFSGIERPRTAAGSSSGPKRIIEKLWRDFFSDPSQWWDHRSEKENPKYPDFKHKETRAGLWLNDILNPPWVEAELSASALETLQEHVFSWNKRLAKYVKGRQYETALELFDQMQQEGICPDRFTFTAIVKACARLRALQEGRHIHTQILQSGYGSDLYLSSGLVDMYARCGSIEDAQRVFDKMSIRDVASWNAIILGHAKCGQGQKALELSREMQVEGMEPDTVTLVGMLNACASIAALQEGRHIHEQIIQRGLDSGIFVGCSLIHMYSTCGSLDDACRVFDRMPIRDVACWNALIQGCVECGEGQKALDLSKQMQQECWEPNIATFVGLLNACASVGALKEGRHFHEQAIQRSLESGVFVGISLIHMYTECGRITDAWRVFNRMSIRNVMSWNAMIEGCVKCRQAENAFDLYRAMHRESVEPDSNTFVGVINACASLAKLKDGRRFHVKVIQRGMDSAPFMGISLIHMYARCGSMDDAWTVFNEMPMHDVVCWNAIIQGYVKCGQGQKALDLYLKMQLESVEPNIGTFVVVLNACASVGALEEGKTVDAQIHERGLESDVSIVKSLSRMYARFERIKGAQTIFYEVPANDVVSSVERCVGDLP